MHPILGDRQRRRVFLWTWPPIGAALGLALLRRAGGDAGDWWAVVLWAETLAVPLLAAAYVGRAAPIASSGVLTIFGTIGAAAAFTAGAWVTSGRLWLWLVSWAAPSAYARFDRMLLPASGAAILLFVLMSAVHYTLSAADAREEALGRALEAEIAAREAELRALRAQVDPHFLFNCLHSIGALIASDPGGARWMCLELAELFRESLRAGAQARISMAAEVALVRRYLEIEQRRFGDRLRTSVQLEPAAEATLLPPLLLQPLAENAVRHGIATLIEGGAIAISIARHGDRVDVRVENPYDADSRRGGTGVGLVNVRARLDTTYRGRASLKVDTSEDRFVATVSLPAEDR